ncbi:TAFII55 protein conserved region-domain-containing protein [Apodospora peruviana]|uniref:TAFII55 protein conserved region-domain-containing protein n=1 Tax=Apodospora peruviana TaxID=516989 RepID=A0AAE0IRW7_9PEZI|nr:TAFII55 protein conserved region-domain-containing protein [Apodospora peruviana]
MEQPPPPPPKRLTLKISNLPNGSSSITAATPPATTPGASFLSAASPLPQTPSGGPPKIKLIRKSLPSTPADGMPPSTMRTALPGSAGGRPLPTPAAPKVVKPKAPKKTSPKKRPKPTDDDDDEDTPLANGTSHEPKKKKPKITLIKTPSSAVPKLKVKPVGRVPTRPLGEGYDSEAEDREIDPVIEDQVLLRMMPGEHLDYLREHVNKRSIGVPKSHDGADIQLKFLDEQGRRAIFKVKDQAYAAILLDLPTITEGMKTWDKKSMVKSADICQMLLVFAKVKDEEEVKTVSLPKAVEHGHRWPHGITPPMHDARNRRFRKRLSKLEIQNKEAEVERLLAADKEAVASKYEFIDERQTQTGMESGDEYEEEEEDGEADAEGEIDDYFGDAEAPDDSFDVDDAALEAEFMDVVETPAEQPTDLATPAAVGGTDAITPVTATGTPAAQTEESGGEAGGAVEEESGDDDEDDDDGDEGDDDDMDGDGDEDRHDEVAGVRNEINQLKKQLAGYEEQYAKMTQVLMKKRIEGSIKSLKAEIKLKQSSIGEADEDDD